MKTPLYLITLFILPFIHHFVSAKTDKGNNMLNLEKNWELIPADSVSSFEALHQLDWQSDASHRVSVPNTVFGALVEDGTYQDPFWGKRLAEIDKTPFQSNWFYRKVFDLDATLPSDYVEIVLEGFNFRANVWLNGQKIGDAEELVGPFRIYELDVSPYVFAKNNVLVIEIIRPAKDDLTIGWVDWNPYPPDDNIGLWRPVMVRQTGNVSLNDLFVKTDLDLPSLEKADIEITGTLVNHSSKSVKGMVKFNVGEHDIHLQYALDADTRQSFRLNKDTHPVLRFENPDIWWPHHMGKQPLYHLKSEVVIDDQVSDKKQFRFGVREVDDYINEQGHRGWTINGKEILIRGGGWVDDLFLREDPERVIHQVQYTKHMNLNTIRLEGFWGSSKTLFDTCDEEGILLMIGWSCHWEWENYCGRPTDNYLAIKTPEDIAFHAQSYREQVIWLRNHPSVLMWVFASDMLPRPELERALYKHLDEVDPTRPRLAGCRQKSQDGEWEYTSEVSGPVAVKMVGPYSYVTPNYWYEDKQLGGAFGFNTETGPGLQPTVYESVRKFTPEEDLWPINDTWAFHTGRGVFATFENWLPAFNARYGEADSVEDFCFRAQMSNYEAIRSMFEAFAVNKPEATGVIQWMLNSAFPNHLWQLYDYYLMPTGAFYGAKKACQPLNVVYDYANHCIHVTNEFLESFEDYEVVASVYDQESQQIWTAFENIDIDAQSSQMIIQLPPVSELPDPLYFLHLSLKNPGDDEVASNFYWLSTKADVCEYEKSNWHLTPNSQYADLRGIRELRPANIDAGYSIERKNGEIQCEVTLINHSEQIAFFIELAAIDESTGESILPVLWDDNYISILPGGIKKVTATFPAGNAKPSNILCRITGMNIEEQYLNSTTK
ncbi:MAG: hypothetical protein MI748_12595 [Opitutales bacterium]|nr:hypothetical protein [Opitutales bacterium]